MTPPRAIAAPCIRRSGMTTTPSPFPPSMPAYRPPIEGSRHGVVAGHYLAAHAGFAIFNAGGNAIDAGVAAGMALGVLQSNFVGFAGVAPIIIYSAEKDELISIDGLGTWPKAATLEMFEKGHRGTIPEGLLRTVVPAAPAAWIEALIRYGTMSFGDIAEASIRFAREGFVMYPLMSDTIGTHRDGFARWAASAAIYLPGGQVPTVGDLFVQSDLARTIQYMADEEKAAAKRGRVTGLEAARAAFYSGDIAKTICDYHKANGGLLSLDDMANYRLTIERPPSIRWGEMDVYTCGPWCQGPVLLQALQILKGYDLKRIGHNTADYVHVVTEALKLACADRERYYGDPKFIDVPLDTLLSEAYGAQRRGQIRLDQAWPELPPAGDIPGTRHGAGGARAA
ncbi:MAG: gamma-glutamyltransferase family protein, partial [Alphaproteobacteria bacterium]|nr:gamma-glutamyltransferase family protein [Alphaproteobacteria bacterium]